MWSRRKFPRKSSRRNVRPAHSFSRDSSAILRDSCSLVARASVAVTAVPPRGFVQSSRRRHCTVTATREGTVRPGAPPLRLCSDERDRFPRNEPRSPANRTLPFLERIEAGAPLDANRSGSVLRAHSDGGERTPGHEGEATHTPAEVKAAAVLLRERRLQRRHPLDAEPTVRREVEPGAGPDVHA